MDTMDSSTIGLVLGSEFDLGLGIALSSCERNFLRRGHLVKLRNGRKTRVSIESMEGGMQALSMPMWTRQQQAAAGSRGSSCIQNNSFSS